MQKIKNKMLIILIILTLIVPFFITPISFAYDNMISTNEQKEASSENVIEEDSKNNNIEENETENNTENNTNGEENKNETEKDTNQEEDKNETEETNKDENENIENSVSEDVTIKDELQEETENRIEVKSDEIEEGIYYIKTSIDEKEVLDVKDNSKENGASIQLWEKSAQSTDNQKFEITKTESGNYIIKAMHSVKVLEEKEGSKIQQYEINNKETQEWIINKTENGYYNIISKSTGLYLDVPGAMATNGRIIGLYEGNETNAQKFKLEKIEELASEKTIEDGTYYIKSEVNTNEVFDVTGNSYSNGANIQLWGKSAESTDNQKFEVKYLSDGYCEIRATHSSKVLDVAGAGTTNGTRIQQYDSNGSDAQKWIIKEAGDGYYYIISKCNGLYIDIPGGIVADGSNVQMYEGNGSAAQKFEFEKIQELVGEKTIEDGKYKIKAGTNETLGFDVESNSKESGANVQIWKESELISKNQRFEIEYSEEGYYTIVAMHSNKVLDVIDGTNLKQNDANGGKSQQWIIRENSDGTYSIISRLNGLYLTMDSVAEGSKIKLSGQNESKNQKFKFQKIEQEKSERLIEDGTYLIITQLQGDKVFDIDSGSYANSAKVQLWSSSGVQQQKFEVKYIEEGYYEIKSVNSGKMLDVEGGSNKNGTRVQQYEANGTDYQKWILQDAGNGYFYIVSKGSELYLDVAGASTADGTKIVTYEPNGTNAQKFKFEKIQIMPNDNYNIETALGANKVLDVDLTNLNLQIWTLNPQSENQRFKLEYVNGYYKILCSATNKVLTVNDSSLIQSAYEGTDNQKWIIETAGNGYYFIKSKSTGLYLDVAGASNNDGTKVSLYEKNGTDAQKFTFKSVNVFYGIDVSYANGLVNWLEVKNSNKVSFSIIRAAYRGYETGKIVTDNQFERNIMQASSSGIDIGLYFFTQATNEAEAIEEADYIVNLIRTHNIPVKYPIAIDTEYSGSKTNGENDYAGRADNLTPTERTNVCIAFCERIKSYGYTPMIYASKNWFYNNLEADRLTGYDHWVAHYTGSVDSPTDYKYHYTMWQYTSSGSVSGINGTVDLNVCNKKY